MRVLLADADDCSRNLMSETLAKTGQTVRQCRSGREALKELYFKRFDLVISDVAVPGLSGIELLKAVKALPDSFQAPVVLVTDNPSLDSSIEAFRAGAYDYLRKPGEIKKVLDILNEICQEKVHYKVSNNMVKVLVWDERPIVFQAISRSLLEAGGFVCLGNVKDLKECLVKVQELSPDILILDIQKEDDAAHICGMIKKVCPSTKIIVYSGKTMSNFVSQCIQGGADAFVAKQRNDANDIIFVMKKVIQGGLYIEPFIVKESLQSRAHQNHSFVILTEQEKKILFNVVQGKTNKEVAMELHLSHGTVRNYVSRIMAKTSVTNRASLVVWGTEYFRFENPKQYLTSKGEWKDKTVN